MADIGGWGELPDGQLVARAVGSPAAADRARAFTAIYNRHGQAVLRFCSGWLGDPLLVSDVVQETFTAAFVELRRGRPPADTRKLRPWLVGIARHRCLQAVQRRRETPHDGIVEPAPDDVEGSNRRLAEVERLLLVVADTFTDKQRKVFDLAVRQGLRGRRLAEVLGVKPEQASRLTNEVIRLAHEGFGALVLARDGRPYCAQLAQILDEAGGNGALLSPVLRQRILRHISDCRTCDDCSTCREQQRRLVAPYAPVVIPALVSTTVEDRVERAAQDVAHRRTPPALPKPPRGLFAGPVPAVVLVTGLIIGGAALVQRAQDQNRREADPAIETIDALQPLDWPDCNEVLADVFPRNDVEGWDNEELAGKLLEVPGWDVDTRSIDLIAEDPDDRDGPAIALFIRDGRLVERIDIGSADDQASLRLQELLDELYPAIPESEGGTGHRQGVTATFRRMSNEANLPPRYIFEECFDSG
jgi:RNA polymerase sigma factor (sigma-70 family)